MKEGISVLLPAYKEAENLKKIIPQIQQVLYNVPHEILVIDTESKMDETSEVCLQYQCRYIMRKGGNSYGDAIRTGINAADHEYLLVMDADGSHNPEDILRFYEEISKGAHDLIIGSRYCKGGNTHNGIILRFMSRILNFTYRIVFQLDVKDVSDSFRLYRTQQVKEITLQCDNFDIVEELLIRLQVTVKNFNIRELPIYFSKRESGESKRDLLKFMMSYLKTMVKLYHIKKQELSLEEKNREGTAEFSALRGRKNSQNQER